MPSNILTAQSIVEVIQRLEHVIDWSKANNSRIGYFACLYRKMTISVRDGINGNSFENGKRMELLDVIFANRFLQALDSYINNRPCTNAWRKAFDTTKNDDLIVLQHLFLGINTHINLDLCIAAAQTTKGGNIYELENDFNKINDVIAHTMQSVQNDLCEIWPPLKVLINISNNKQQAVLNFSITAARKASWANAVALASIDTDKNQQYINSIDNTVVKLADGIINPGFVMSLLLKPIRSAEDESIQSNIECLYN